MEAELRAHRRGKLPCGKAEGCISKGFYHLLARKEIKISTLCGTGILSIFFRRLDEIFTSAYFRRDISGTLFSLFYFRFRSTFTNADQNMPGMHLFRIGKLSLARLISGRKSLFADSGRICHFFRIKQNILQFDAGGQSVLRGSCLIRRLYFRI